MLASLGVLSYMRKKVAGFLLLFALAGNIVPLALAATTAPLHACCIRKSAHHCHDSASSNFAQLMARGAGCCGHDCCRAASISQHASPPSERAVISSWDTSIPVAESESSKAGGDFFAARSTRGPPLTFLA